MHGERSSGINRTDLIAGLAVITGCATTAWLATDYGLGTPRRMGAGWFPFAVSILGMSLGLAIAVHALFGAGDDGPGIRWRRLFFVCAAFLLFAAAIEPLGLFVTIPAVALLGAKADPTARTWESLILGIGLALAIWVVFVQLLGLNIPVLPEAR